MADEIRIELPQYSMFSETPVYHGITETVDDEEQSLVVFGLMGSPVVPDVTDTLYTVRMGGESRLDLISAKFYGVSDLWWVIARVNHIRDALIGPSMGTILRIPTKSRLSALGILNI